MGKTTKIAWTDSTLNTCYGCTKVSPGCENCYMFRIFGNRRSRIDPAQPRFRNEDKVLHELKQCGELVFVNSMSDTFHESFTFEQIKFWMDIFEKDDRGRQFQILTKRIMRAKQYAEKYGLPANVWLGTSVEDRMRTMRIRTLQSVKEARIRFISFEPLLQDVGELDLSNIHWAIVGGESDYKHPRPMKEEWAESIRLQCEKQGVAFFFKQKGGVGGDGAGGDLLNGKHYHEMPYYESHSTERK